MSNKDFLTIERASSKTICSAWFGSIVVEKPLLSPVSCLQHSNKIFSILAAIGIEILLSACEYYGVTPISSIIETIEAP